MTQLPETVHFIAHCPPDSLPRLFSAIGGPFFPFLRIRAAGDICHFRNSRFNITESCVERNEGLCMDQFAKAHELMDAHIVVLNPCPGGIFAGRPFIPVADAVAPVVSAYEITARPAIDGRIQFTHEGKCIGAKAVHMIVGHEGRSGDEDAPFPGKTESEAGMRIRTARCQLKGKASEFSGNAFQRAGGFLPGIRSPLQHCFRLINRTFTAEIHITFIGISGDHFQSGMSDAAQAAFFVQNNSTVLFSAERILPAHENAFRRSDDLPGRSLQNLVGLSVSLPGGFIALMHAPAFPVAVYREEKFPVFQHLRPDAAINAATQVFNELSINIRGDRRVFFFRADGNRIQCGTVQRKKGCKSHGGKTEKRKLFHEQLLGRTFEGSYSEGD
ncbi:MAG: hypothetical protein BWY07_02391 [Candidatus Hydrogenedentes bacterium ADurb.Bin170]|nr:MAG: hypothetical protein BWY07_02391 [Candidatus Hydrogenedentes bacterium ADurb.Bin170]